MTGPVLVAARATDPVLVAARTTLLDALDALAPHRSSLVLVGAQAIYLHTGAADVALPEFTNDADIAVDTRELAAEPRIEQALRTGGFVHDPENPNPGAWVSASGTPVDLMVPDAIAGHGRRGVTAPPHDRASMRRTVGIETALVDSEVREIAALDGSSRVNRMRVAGPAALLIAKLHKLADRREQPRRRDNKDAHDVYRLLVATQTAPLAARLDELRGDALSAAVTDHGIGLLRELFARDALGARMAGLAEEGIGDPAQTSLAASILAGNLVAALGR